MKRNIIYLVLLAITLSANTTPVFAETDGKIYSGTGCRPEILWDDEIITYGGGGVNNLAGAKWFECPITLDLGKIYSVQVRVIDKHPTKDIVCRVYDADAFRKDWYYQPYFAGSSWGSSPDIQKIDIKRSGYTTGQRYSFLRCYVPEPGDGISKIVNYYVEERR
jgi:hypothetical protein